MGPLGQVRAAMAAGARTPGELQEATGLSRPTVVAALEHLTYLGVLDKKVDYAACSGCSQTAQSCTGCGSGRGLVTLQLRAPVREGT